MTEEMTGKPYEAGDLSVELDKRAKSAVAKFCGKDSYEFGDLSKEIDRRVKDRVAEYTGKAEYEFGDISREVEKRRREWVKGYLGDEAAEQYQFGDITKKALSNLTGNDDYQVRYIRLRVEHRSAFCFEYKIYIYIPIRQDIYTITYTCFGMRDVFFFFPRNIFLYI